MGALAAPETPARPGVKLLHHQADALFGNLAVARLAQDYPGVQVEADELQVVFQQLFALRFRPVGGGGMAEETALHRIVHRRISHPVEGLAGHYAVEILPGGAVEMQHQAQDAGVGEFRFAAEPAMSGVIGPGHYAGHPVHQRGVRFGAGGGAAGLLPAMVQQFAGLRV